MPALGLIARIQEVSFRTRIPSFCLAGAVLMAVAIFIFTHLPNDKVPRFVTEIGDDKFRHVLFYGLFSALLLVGLDARLPSRLRSCFLVLVISAVFSGVDELTQPLTGRTCSFLDFLASMGGVLAGVAAVLFTKQVCQLCKTD
jgi:VanZ family protein